MIENIWLIMRTKKQLTLVNYAAVMALQTKMTSRSWSLARNA